MKRVIFIFTLIAAGISLFLYRSFIPESKPGESQLEVIAENLEIPWEIEFLPASPAGGPDGNILFTERPGRVRVLNQQTHEIEDVAHVGEGGLLGLTLHPDFRRNNFIYLYYTYRTGERILNKVERFILTNNSLQQSEVIIDNIPGAVNHDGGRIKFGPDGKLYITTGDAGQESLAQDKNSLAGKILRLNEDGSIPEDNPFENSSVWSYGHRNPQGLAWDEKGQLWITEHGSSAFDEINLVQKGKNYGWPEIRGDSAQEGMEAPFLHSGNNTWAPSGAVIKNGKLYFAGLRGGAILELDLQTKELKTHFQNRFGRLRTITLGPNGYFYILTSNKDGRGTPVPEDDRIIKIRYN